VLCKFPSSAITGEIDEHAKQLTKHQKHNRDMFDFTVQPIVQLLQRWVDSVGRSFMHRILFRYRCGTRGHMKLVVEDLLRLYLVYEQFFQVHQYDKCVSVMREQVLKVFFK